MLRNKSGTNTFPNNIDVTRVGVGLNLQDGSGPKRGNDYS